jgi:hypothetical protein
MIRISKDINTENREMQQTFMPQAMLKPALTVTKLKFVQTLSTSILHASVFCAYEVWHVRWKVTYELLSREHCVVLPIANTRCLSKDIFQLSTEW